MLYPFIAVKASACITTFILTGSANCFTGKVSKEGTRMRTTGRRQIQLQNSEHSGSATEQIDNFFDSDDAASNRSANEAENWNGEVNHQASRARSRNDANKRRRSRRNAAKPKPNQPS